MPINRQPWSGRRESAWKPRRHDLIEVVSKPEEAHVSFNSVSFKNPELRWLQGFDFDIDDIWFALFLAPCDNAALDVQAHDFTIGVEPGHGIADFTDIKWNRDNLSEVSFVELSQLRNLHQAQGQPGHRAQEPHSCRPRQRC